MGSQASKSEAAVGQVSSKYLMRNDYCPASKCMQISCGPDFSVADSTTRRANQQEEPSCVGIFGGSPQQGQTFIDTGLRPHEPKHMTASHGQAGVSREEAVMEGRAALVFRVTASTSPESKHACHVRLTCPRFTSHS